MTDSIALADAEILGRLANLIGERNEIDKKIAHLIDRPALAGHPGEFIAAKVFGIKLEYSAAKKSFDGYFMLPPLAGRSVNVKFYSKQDGNLDISPDALPDFYLVLTGPRIPATSSRGDHRPMVIHSVHLFEARPLNAELRQRGLKIGTATSVRQLYWQAATIYPEQRSQLLILTEQQRQLLALFQ